MNTVKKGDKLYYAYTSGYNDRIAVIVATSIVTAVNKDFITTESSSGGDVHKFTADAVGASYHTTEFAALMALAKSTSSTIQDLLLDLEHQRAVQQLIIERATHVHTKKP